MRRYYTYNGFTDINVSDKELFEKLLTAEPIPEIYDAVYDEFLKCVESKWCYFMPPMDSALDYPVNTFEYGASEYLKSVHRGAFKGLYAVIKDIEVRPNDVLVNVVTLHPDYLISEIRKDFIDLILKDL